MLALGDSLYLVTEREELVLALLIISFCYFSVVHTHLVSKAGLELLTLLPLPLEYRYFREEPDTMPDKTIALKAFGKLCPSGATLPGTCAQIRFDFGRRI